MLTFVILYCLAGHCDQARGPYQTMADCQVVYNSLVNQKNFSCATRHSETGPRPERLGYALVYRGPNGETTPLTFYSNPISVGYAAEACVNDLSHAYVTAQLTGGRGNLKLKCLPGTRAEWAEYGRE